MVKRGRKTRSRRHRGGEGLTGRSMSGGEGLTGRSMSGGEGLTGRSMSGGGSPLPLTPGAYSTNGQPYTPSQYYTQSAGRRKRRSLSRKTKKGGSVLATAAVPFGLLALQRYFMGSKTAKKGMRNMGRSVKRTFRRHRGGAEGIPFAVPPS